MSAPLARGATRFAPTPTGRLHVGNARTALLSWLWGRSLGLRNVLRVEDLDPAAIPAGCLEGQYADLAWLGLVWDEGPREGGPFGPYRQSARGDRYDAALAALDALGLLYPCYCSRREVAQATRAPHASDEGPVYPGTCRPALGAVLGDLSAVPTRAGRPAALRLDVARALAYLGWSSVVLDDRVAGPQAFDVVETMGDFVVRRSDGVAAYQTACAWDDAEMACTHVLRGDDLLASAARQALLLALWGRPRPVYAHVGLVVTPSGERLAKRDNAVAIEVDRLAGHPPHALLARLAATCGLPASHDLDTLTAALTVGPALAQPAVWG